MGMAYANNLVYVVCFYLTVMGLGLARSINDNVNEARIEAITSQEIFAGAPQKLQVQIRNDSKNKLHHLELRLDKKSDPTIFEIGPQESKVVEVLWTPPKRGHNKAPSLRLNSQFPSGLFNAWKIKKFTDEIIVYPALTGQKNYPDTAQSPHESIGVLREIRDYKPGDSPRRIHWRSLAKNGQLRTMVHESQDGQSCHFAWEQLGNMKLEDKLSQLALWLHQAQTNSQSWTLTLPDHEYSSLAGTQSYHAALKALALWKETA